MYKPILCALAIAVESVPEINDGKQFKPSE
jgi:hypothetical protein